MGDRFVEVVDHAGGNHPGGEFGVLIGWLSGKLFDVNEFKRLLRMLSVIIESRCKFPLDDNLFFRQRVAREDSFCQE